jgi:acyl-CoA synthetase (NDP forming)
MPVEVHRRVWVGEAYPVPVTAEQVVGQPSEAYLRRPEVLAVPDGVDPALAVVLQVLDLQVVAAVPAAACPVAAAVAYAEAAAPVMVPALALVPA